MTRNTQSCHGKSLVRGGIADHYHRAPQTLISKSALHSLHASKLLQSAMQSCIWLTLIKYSQAYGVYAWNLVELAPAAQSFTMQQM